MANLKPNTLLQSSMMIYTVLLVCFALNVTCVPIESHRQLTRRQTAESNSLKQLKAGTVVLRRFLVCVSCACNQLTIVALLMPCFFVVQENQLFKMTDDSFLPARLTNGTFASLSVMQRYVHLINDGFGGNSDKLTLLSRVLQQVIKDSCLWVCMKAFVCLAYTSYISIRGFLLHISMIRTVCS